MNGVTTGWRDHLVGLLLAVTYVALLWTTSYGLGMSRDESFYIDAATSYGRWYQQFWEDPSAALEPDVLERGWRYNYEHPALIKTMFALSWLADEAWDLYPLPTLAFRFPGMLLSGLLLWLIYIFGARLFGRPAGAFAALAFALLPRPFYHAHLDCFDVPITLMVTLVAYCYWRSLTERRWAIWTGVAFGLALATKHNSWALPGIFLIHFLWTVAVERRARAGGAPPRVAYAPWWLLSMVVIGPLVFVGTWPYLWDQTLERIGRYVSFHLRHDYYNIVYFGHTYFEPPFPVSVPFVLTLFTVPLTTLALFFFGLGPRLRAVLPRRWAERAWPRGAVTADRACTDVLLLGLLLAPMVMIALPSSPIFGGTKHWMPSYPILVIYAGLGFARLVEHVRGWLGDRVPRARYAAPAVVAGLLLAPSVLETEHSHPFGLSHYTLAAGGVPGAADHGMNRQFWGFTTGSVTGFLNERMPERGRVYICDTTPVAWRMLQEDGLLAEHIRPSGSMLDSDYALVHHEDHFAEVEFQAWVAYGSVQPAHVLTYDGVPIVTIYENPRMRARAQGSNRGPVR